ncbi:MAG: hypothetical protein KKD39_08855 [Candidatus Altiarchaeota archaeon]|nr:hypothetical protein [Candidatus Altiarchaeota archaeon]
MVHKQAQIPGEPHLPELKSRGQEAVTHRGFNPKDIVDGMLRGESILGKVIQPLVNDLAALPQERQVESVETLGLIHSFLKGENLADVELTREDILFLITTKVGDLLRRPVLHGMFADKIEAEIETSNATEETVKGHLVTSARASRWSRFISEPAVAEKIKDAKGLEDVYIDMEDKAAELADAIGASPKKAYLITMKTFHIAKNMRETNLPKVRDDFNWYTETQQGRKDKSVEFYTDPGHAFNQGYDVMFIRRYVKAKSEIRFSSTMPAFLRETSFMLVEDNPVHGLLADIILTAENAKAYAPDKKDESTEPLTKKSESKGRYTSAERALDVMYGAANTSGSHPDVILADIELLGKMRGIEFIREVHRREVAAGRKPMIMMVYSSNPRPYTEDIKRLKDEGIIADHWHKEDFTPEKLIETVNEQMKAQS